MGLKNMGQWENFVVTGRIEDYLKYAKEKQTCRDEIAHDVSDGKDGIACAGKDKCHGNNHKTSSCERI